MDEKNENVEKNELNNENMNEQNNNIQKDENKDQNNNQMNNSENDNQDNIQVNNIQNNVQVNNNNTNNSETDNKNKTNKKKSNKKIIAIVVISIVVGLILILGTVGFVILKFVNNVRSEKYQITEILARYGTDGTAIVKIKDDSVYVINENGKIVGTLPKDLSSVKYKNGYVLVNPNEEDDGESYVMDNKGNILLPENENIIYKDITDDGYIVQEITEESLAGETTYFAVTDINGNQVLRIEEDDCNDVEAIGKGLIFKDLRFDDNSIVNIETKKETFTNDNRGGFEDLGNGFFIYQSYSEDNDYIVDSNSCMIYYFNYINVIKMLNNSYIYGESDGKPGIYDLDGNLVKDLTEGGVTSIYYANNKYYVISETDYFYTLDNSFNYVDQPQKISLTIKDITPSGIIVMVHNEVDYTDLQDVLNNSTNDYLIKFDDFNVNIDPKSVGNKIDGVNVSYEGKYAYTNDVYKKITNLENLEEITIKE